MSSTTPSFIKWFDDISKDDVPLVGGKNASLGEMYCKLKPEGIPVPHGFAITAEAYRYMLTKSDCWGKLHEVLDNIDPSNMDDLSKKAAEARDIVYSAQLPHEMVCQIIDAYSKLCGEFHWDVSLAVRSSATAEDLPTASFAGQQDSYLNVKGITHLLESCRRCFASLFTDRAIHYRLDQNFDHFKVALSIGIQKMVRSDLGCSGIMFSLDTESGFRDVMFITSSFGLGEPIVQGAVDPDEFYVHKPTFELGYRSVLRKVLGSKKIKMIYSGRGTKTSTRTVVTKKAEREMYSLTDSLILQLSDYGMRIEKHFGNIPMDIEWAYDGYENQLYIVQARPETVISQRKDMNMIEEYSLTTQQDILPDCLITGHAIGSKIATGTVRVIDDVSQLNTFLPGEILVTDSTTPDWEPIMKTASAIITDRGGRTCHSAIVSRELGLPAIIGTERATVTLNTGDKVTVCCSYGDIGQIFPGVLDFKCHRINIQDLPRPKTKIMLNIANPAMAFKHSFLPVDGVGLARMEFIIAEHIKIHPMALIHMDQVLDEHSLTAIKHIIGPHCLNPPQFFVNKLAEGIATIAAAFYPREVIVRMSDFKTNEYAQLLGGKWFEQIEENPMLGFRGASRYTHPAYEEAFKLECDAILKVRNDMGMKNVALMIPFCRTIDEAKNVIAVMKRYGLSRVPEEMSIDTTTAVSAEYTSGFTTTPRGVSEGIQAASPSATKLSKHQETLGKYEATATSMMETEGSGGSGSGSGSGISSSGGTFISMRGPDGCFPSAVTEQFKLYMMCEIPNNVICIESFLDFFDGISIGSNDLTQLCLGVDRDSAILSKLGLFDERQPGMKKMFAMAINGANKRRKYCGVCGQAPSDYPEIAEFLVHHDIQSMSLNADVVMKTIPLIVHAERSHHAHLKEIATFP